MHRHHLLALFAFGPLLAAGCGGEESTNDAGPPTLSISTADASPEPMPPAAEPVNLEWADEPVDDTANTPTRDPNDPWWTAEISEKAREIERNLGITEEPETEPAEVGGKTLPSPFYLEDDVEFFPAGPEFDVTDESSAEPVVREIPE